jgi:hypothetical protein
MGFDAYDSEELEELSKKERQELREAVFRELATSKEIRRLLRERTQGLYEQFTRKKP